MKTCQWCDDPFEPKVGYQIYCSSECREEATKEKIAQRYLVARRNKMMGKKRECKSCGSPLSAYNDDPICHGCLINPIEVSRALKEIRGSANGKPKRSK
jgi:hypothetical protein